MVNRSSFMSSSRNSRLDNLGQTALCCTAVVIAIIIFTIMAATYEPHDRITHFFALKSDSSIEISDVESAIAQFEEPAAIADTRDCRVDDPIDCRDPDVFHSLMRAAINRFKDIHFYRFGKPVPGDNDTSCHMAWRFRPKAVSSAASTAKFNKDYRTFTVVRHDNCTVSVLGIGDYHSGGNARNRKAKAKGNDKEGSNEALETVNDALPVVESEASFVHGKYLIYSGGGDRCKSMSQFLWSFTCMLGEAQHLNRTLVMDMSICLSKLYSSSGVNEEGKDFRFYFDFEHLKNSASVLDQIQFWSLWEMWHQKNRLNLHLVEGSKIPPTKLAGLKDTLIMRKFGFVEPDNYWYHVCEGEAESVIQRPWHMIRKSRRFLDVVSTIVDKMNRDFDAIHVERGEKAKNKELWPNLDRDTQPEALIGALQNKVGDGRNLYVSTDEPNAAAFFSPLKEKYSIHFLDDYKDLWDVSSVLYHEMMLINGGNSVEFDGYMRILVDTEVFLRGKTRIETFNDLTTDCREGVDACTKTS